MPALLSEPKILISRDLTEIYAIFDHDTHEPALFVARIARIEHTYDGHAVRVTRNSFGLHQEIETFSVDSYHAARKDALAAIERAAAEYAAAR